MKATLESLNGKMEAGGEIPLLAITNTYNRITESGSRDLTKYAGNVRNDIFYAVLFVNVGRTEVLYAWLRFGLRKPMPGVDMWAGLEHLLKLQWKSAKNHMHAEACMRDANFSESQVQYIKSKVDAGTFSTDRGHRVKTYRKMMRDKWLPRLEEDSDLWRDTRVCTDDMDLSPIRVTSSAPKRRMNADPDTATTLKKAKETKKNNDTTIPRILPFSPQESKEMPTVTHTAR